MAENLNMQEKPISLIVATSNGRHYFNLDKNLRVIELKQLIYAKTQTPVDWLILSYDDKTMKNNDSLKDLGLEDSAVISLTVDPNLSQNSPMKDADVTKSPYGLGALGGLEGLSTLGATSSYLQLQRSMQTKLLQDPQLLQQVLSNPYVKSFMDKPEYLTQLLTCFPEMNQLIQRDPEVASLLSQTDLLRQTNLLISENPSILNTLMGDEKPESHPPKSEGAGVGLRRSRRNKPDTSEPLLGQRRAKKAKPEEPESSQDDEEDQPQEGQRRAKKAKPDNKGETSKAKAGVFNSAPFVSLLSDMVANPEVVRQLYSAPHIQAMVAFLVKNPSLAEQFVLSHPMFASNPHLKEQMKAAMPFCLEMMLKQNNIEVFSPDVLQPLLQIHQGLDKLYSLAPHAMLQVPGTSPPKDNSFDTFVATFAQAMAQQTSPEPEVRYTSQLEQLKVMGFHNSALNLKALIETEGDVNKAILQLAPTAEPAS